MVGVDGELKQVAMAALSTRANFAYTRSEVRLGGGWCCCGWVVAGWWLAWRPFGRVNRPQQLTPFQRNCCCHLPPLGPSPFPLPLPSPPLPRPSSILVKLHSNHHQQIMDDMHRVFDTGYFSLCKPVAEETRDGIKLTLEVAPNPELRGFTVTGANMLPQVGGGWLAGWRYGGRVALCV